MISNSRITTTLPAVDLSRAKEFYHDVLGLNVTMEDQMSIMLETREGSSLYLYKREPTKADHTVLSFDVKDIESEIKELRRKGVKFEEYDIPSMGLKTVKSIATYGDEKHEYKSAWFKDTEGNILALNQMVKLGVGGKREEREPVSSRR
jgi:predicted enzyme related to lactoylglutathione lyase